MRARTFGLTIAAVAIGYALLTAPEALWVTAVLLGAAWLWRATRRSGVRR